MKRISNRQSLRQISEISITPLLILVLMVLLVFLMAVPLLKAGRGSASVKPATSATLAVAQDQTITLDGSVVAQAVLLETLKKRLAEQPKLGVVVKMDRKLPVQNLLEIMAVLKAAGVRYTGVASTIDAKS
jgi:biopolymer transport protein TolR